MKTKQKTLTRLLSFGLVVSAVVAQTLFPLTVSADQIVDRKLTLEAGTNDGGSKPGGLVNHFFEFELPGGSDVGSIKFEYCTTAANSAASPACVGPTGLNTSTSTLTNESGATGFSNLTHTSANELYISRASAAAVGADQAVSYRVSGVTNPTAANETFFVRISTYETTNATGTATDAGTVTASTAEQIDLTGTMPESLVFCTGATVPLNLSLVPDCGNATPGDITFNKLFSPTDTAIATSQMAASTNAGAGYVITVNGSTLASGSNEINEIASADTSKQGISQFGMNLKLNTDAASSSFPFTSAEVAPLPNEDNYRGQAAAGYDTVDTFKYTDGEVVANSFDGGAGGTDTQIFTASYIVNVPGNQPAGTYTTTLTYICTPTF